MTIKDSFKAMYDKAAELWQELHAVLKEEGSATDSKMVRVFLRAQRRVSGSRGPGAECGR